MRTKETEKLKINAESIRITLFNNNKKLIKLRKNENTLLKRLKNVEKKEKKEGFIEGIRNGFLSNLGSSKMKIKGKSDSITNNIMEFFGLIGGALIIDSLPEIIESATKFLRWAKGVFESIQTFMKDVSESIDKFVSIFDSTPIDQDKLENQNKEIIDGLKDIEEGSQGLNSLKSSLENFQGEVEDRSKSLKEQNDENVKVSENVRENSDEFRLSESTSVAVQKEVGTAQIISMDERASLINTEIPSNNNDNTSLNIAKREKFESGGRVGPQFERSSLATRGDAFNVFRQFEENIIAQSSIIKKQEESNNFLLDILRSLTGIFQKPSMSEITNSRDSLRNTTMKMLGAYEGLSLNAYKDTEGIPTIGFGATTLPTWITGENKDRPVKMGDTITTEQAYKLKDHDYNRHRVIVEEELSEVGISLDKLPVNVSSVLMSLAFNYGSLKGAHSGTNTVFNGRKFPDSLPVMVKKAYTSNDYSNIADLLQFNLINDNSGDLTNRRLSESNIIRTGSGTGFFGLQDLNLPLNSSSKSLLNNNESSNSQLMQYDVSKIQRSPVLSTEIDDNLTIISIRDQVIIPVEV